MCTRPTRARSAAVVRIRSSRIEVATTGPGASMTCPAAAWLLPSCGAASIRISDSRCAYRDALQMPHRRQQRGGPPVLLLLPDPEGLGRDPEPGQLGIFTGATALQSTAPMPSPSTYADRSKASHMPVPDSLVTAVRIHSSTDTFLPSGTRN